jgi:hypothetical protein
MVGVERIVDQQSRTFGLRQMSPWDAWNYIAIENWITLLVLLFIAATMKAAFVLFSNEDINLGFEGHGRERYQKIFRNISLPHYLGYCLFTAGWYLIFFILGTALVLLSRFIGRPMHAWIFVGIGFVLLWPIFYAGLSLAAFVFAMLKHRLIKVDAWQSVLRRNYVRLYLFYAMRSAVDAACLIGGPALLATYVSNILVRYTALILLLGFSVLLIRSTAIAFKRSLFGVETNVVTRPE